MSEMEEEKCYLKNYKLKPIVRLQKINIRGFKNVRAGELVFNCGKQFVNSLKSPDIMGIYGQNGSGKSAVIDAIFILKLALSGKYLPGIYAEYISHDTNPESQRPFEYASFDFLLEVQYNNGHIRRAKYSFKIKGAMEEETEEDYDASKDNTKSKKRIKCKIFDECISICEVSSDGQTKSKLLPVIDASEGNALPFGPARKLKEIINKDEETYSKLSYVRWDTQKTGKSFIFDENLLKALEEKGTYYFEVIQELRAWANCYSEVLCSVNDRRHEKTKQTFYYNGLRITLPSLGTFPLPDYMYDILDRQIRCSSIIMGLLIPGFELKLIQYEELFDFEEKTHKVKIQILRNGVEYSVLSESEGIRKLLSEIYFICRVFVDPTIMVAIDELDSGVYEYLLLHLMAKMNEYARGQFIFTVHDLSVLEELDKKFVCFTTTDKDDKYYKMKGIGKSNNLRNTYLRTINAKSTEKLKSVGDKFDDNKGQDKDLYEDNKIQLLPKELERIKRELTDFYDDEK